MPISPEERETLKQAAAKAALSAYARYSEFRVGAAVLGERETYVGVNVENASYGLTTCAERVALANAIAHGERRIRAIAVACIDAKKEDGLQSLLPCGACRQWIAELAPQAEILVVGSDRVFTLDDFLPLAFQLDKA